MLKTFSEITGQPIVSMIQYADRIVIATEHAVFATVSKNGNLTLVQIEFDIEDENEKA